ncbi:Oidioi.mRNA.OKI2018_I69.chr2.g7747.t1.cds [Oikopleura dioica]|uniref:Oidioi.mRNA.OKI2018_I69.chr2.g7747.t1.cds n=1 Tax=Oikopleura dioica TaxID=34765 RepID=A0ABN7TAM9_OIKDI|nr:Oidioi.mRNA.OKI2018_I69.chr2.g7747.t1.cds [Oikopleura dioica]
MEYLKTAQRFRKTDKVARRIEGLQKIIEKDENSSEEESEEEVYVKEEVVVKEEPESMPPTPEHQSPWATNVRISKQILERILLNPKSFIQINDDSSPEHCQYLKIFEPTDYSLFPGGRQFRTKIPIGNEVKLIYSYTPGSYEKYLDMSTATNVIKTPSARQNDQPSSEPRTPPPSSPLPQSPISSEPEPETRPPSPPSPASPQDEPKAKTGDQLPEVFLLYDNSTGQTIHAVKGADGKFEPIGQSKGKIINVSDGQSSGSIMTGNKSPSQENENSTEEQEGEADCKNKNTLKRKAEPIRNG